MNRLTAATYCRYSTELQSAASLVDQRRVCEQIAEREGFIVVAQFEDAAISGGTAQRPGYQNLLAAARRKEFNAIIVEDVSRLWREQAEQWRALKELDELNVHLIGNGIDTRREEESGLLLAVTGAAAEGFRKEIARRTRRGLEGRARNHKSTGGRCFGYVPERDSATGEVEIDPKQAEVVVRIFQDYADGRSPVSIARELNHESIPSPGSYWNRTRRRTSGWQASAIAGDAKRGVGILRNRRYLGEINFGRTQWRRGAADSSKRKVQQRDAPLFTYSDERLRIISEELWQRVEARLRTQSAKLGTAVRIGKQRSGGSGRPSRHLLSRVLVCGQCNSAFTAVNARSYGCSSHVNGGACTGHVHYVKRELVEELILREIALDASSAEFRQLLKDYIAEELRSQSSSLDAVEDDSRIQAELTLLAQQIAVGRATNEALTRCAELTLALQASREPRAVRSDPAQVQDACDSILKTFEMSAASLRSVLMDGDVEHARAILHRLTGDIRLMEAPGRDHLIATYDLGVGAVLEQVRGRRVSRRLEGLSEKLVAGVGFGINLQPKVLRIRLDDR